MRVSNNPPKKLIVPNYVNLYDAAVNFASGCKRHMIRRHKYSTTKEEDLWWAKNNYSLGIIIDPGV